MKVSDNMKLKNGLFELNTPCFVIDSVELCDNAGSFRKELKECHEDCVLAYSVKTNSLPYILSLMNSVGVYAEVVSFDEYRLAKNIGYTADHIVYNGPLKDRDTFFDALSGGAYVNIETKREIEWLSEYRGEKDLRLGIRLNIDLNRISPEDAADGTGSSRFGFSYEDGELEKAIKRINDLGYNVRGLHVHRTSSTRSLDVYDHICGYTVEVISKLGLNLSYVDIGGGFFGNMPGKPGYREYASVICNGLKELGDITVIVEPGNALIASPVSFVCSVIDSKLINGKHIVVTDGSRIDIDPFFHKEKYNYELYSEGSVKSQEQILTGCTCLEKDVITVLDDEPALSVGDRICFKWVGAYTMTLTPDFIRYMPSVYAYDGQEYTLVRSKWTEVEHAAGSIMSSMPGADGYLFLNAGRRAQLIKNMKKSLGTSAKVVATDNWCVAPALFMADKYYLTPKISDPSYMDTVLRICRDENIKAVTTCLDPEIELLAANRERFEEAGITVLCPTSDTARLCFDKYMMFRYLTEKGIRTVLTFDSIVKFEEALKDNLIKYPVFIKPRTGSGSVGAEKIDGPEQLKDRIESGKYDYIIQEYMDCEDLDADVYIDTITRKAVAAFAKKKIETRIGGASKTIAYKDKKLFDFIEEIADAFEFNGPVDMDFFYRDGEYYLSEINPRFGGAYLHGFGAGVDFNRLIRNNVHGSANKQDMGNYDEGSIMLMYDDVVMAAESELRGDYRD